MSCRASCFLMALLTLGACASEEGDTLHASKRLSAHECEPHANCQNTNEPAKLAVSDPDELAKLALLQEVLARPALPGAPGFEKKRAQIVSRAKGEPVLFLRAPEVKLPADKGAAAALQRYQSGRDRFSAVKRVLAAYKANKPSLRALLLREGYLYSEDPDEAFALVSLVSPQALFDEPTLWLQRGERTLLLHRSGKHYVYADSELGGQRVRLMHLDRIGVGTAPEPLHRDLRALKYRLSFDQAHPVHLTERHLVLDLRYGPHWVRSVLESHGARLELAHELIPQAERQALTRAKRDNRRHQAALQRLREAIAAQVSERLPFDEPKTEIGQEDGALRRAWYWAYHGGQSRYEYNLDWYSVFTEHGRPKVPQVCIDFVVDSFERASGTWYNARSEVRARNVGKLDLRQIEGVNLRRTDAFVALAEERPEWFELAQLPAQERVAMGRKREFFRYIEERVADFQPGDIVLIRGTTPWDEEKLHTHAFVIYENDPITRMPILVAGNAGPANLWSWETEARRTPRRSVRYRIRPRSEWLQQVVLPPRAPEQAPSLLPQEARADSA